MGKKAINYFYRRERDPDYLDKLFLSPWIEQWWTGGDLGDDEPPSLRDIHRYCDECDRFHGPGQCGCSERDD